MPLNNRDQAIVDWAKEHMPGAAGSMETILTSEGGVAESAIAAIAIAFEAGRVFQAEHPEFELNSARYY